MKIIDKTPYRQEDGQVTFTDRIQATLKYGLTWYDRIQAQEKILPILDKQLSRNFILLRNITLGGTDVELPLILIGPPGIFLVNVITEKGVYRAKGEEWGLISGDQFAPAKINQILRTSRMGQVLQLFLDRAGLKGTVTVEAILMSANPGTHIESVRPVVRVVMSDALERFAASMEQARGTFSPEMVATLAQIILTGKAANQASPKLAPQEPSQPEKQGAFGFDDAPEPEQTASPSDSFSLTEEPTPAALKQKSKKGKRIAGMSIAQLAILAGILLVWLCIVIIFILYISSQPNG